MSLERDRADFLAEESGSSSVRVRRSSMTTSRSEAISLGSNVKFCIRSASSSITRSSLSAAMLTKYEVTSWEVNALSCPPFSSTSRANCFGP